MAVATHKEGQMQGGIDSDLADRSGFPWQEALIPLNVHLSPMDLLRQSMSIICGCGILTMAD